MRKLLPCLALVALLGGMASAQLVTLGTGIAVNSAVDYPAPYGNYWGGARHQYIIQPAELTGLGVAPGANLNSIGFDVLGVNGQALVNFEIKAGLTAAPDLSLGWIAGTTQVLAPIPSYAPTAGWNMHALTTHIVWDGVSSLVIETCHNNTSFTYNCLFHQTGTAFTSSRWYAYDAAGICANPATTSTTTYRPNMRLSFGVTEYQINQPNAHMDFDFILATPYAPAIDTKCIGGIVNACANSNGLPADIVLNLAPVVPISAGGTVLNANAIVNIDLSAGYFQVFNNFAPLGAAAGTCPIFFAAPAGTLSAQTIVIDFTAPGLIRLSQACQLNGVATGSVTLVNADDATYTVNLGSAPLCHGPLAYYGTSYTQLTVSTNGVVSPGTTGILSFVPNAAQAMFDNAMYGVWSDWQSNANPLATIVVNGAGAFGGVDVTYTNVPYWGTAVNSTFTVGLDAFGPTIRGISGLGTDPTTATMILVSQGGGLATDAGPTAFGIGSGTTVAATDMLYALGTGTPALSGGANNLYFVFGLGFVGWTGI